MAVRTDTIQNWTHDITEGVGGLKDYEKYEMASSPCAEEHELDKRVCWAATWTLECLTNPEYASVLRAVNKRARERLVFPQG